MTRPTWDDFVQIADNLTVADTLVRLAVEELARAIRMSHDPDQNRRLEVRDGMMSAEASLEHAVQMRQQARAALLYAARWWRVCQLPAAVSTAAPGVSPEGYKLIR